MTNIPEGMIPVDKFGKIVGISPEKVIEMIRDGRTVGRKVGDDWFVDNSQLRETGSVSPLISSEKSEMTKFNVYKHPVLGHEVVKNGYSWTGFFFTWIWSFINKLWGTGIILLIVIIPVNSFTFWLLEQSVNEMTIMFSLFSFIPNMIVGGQGNSWKDKSLLKRGYELVDSVEANSHDDALAKYAKLHQENNS